MAVSGLGTFPEIPGNMYLVVMDHVPWSLLAARESSDCSFLTEHMTLLDSLKEDEIGK